MEKDNIILNEDVYTLKKTEKNSSKNIPFVSAEDIDINAIKMLRNKDLDTILSEVQSGDICTLVVHCNSKTRARLGSTDTGVVTKLEDGRLLFKGEYYKNDELINIILKKKNDTNYDDRRISQEEAKKICKGVFEKYYESRLSFLLKSYNARTDLGEILCDESDRYIEEIFAEIMGDNIKHFPTMTQYRKDEYYSAFNAPLIEYLGDSYQTKKIVGVIGNYIDKYSQLRKKSLHWFYDDNKEIFIENALKNLLLLCEDDFLEDGEKQEAINEIRQLDNIEDIIKLLYTYMFSVSALRPYKNIDFIDYTYISVSLFKLTEVIFNKMLTKYWGDTKIISIEENKKAKEEERDPHYIDLSNSKLVLGAMEQFFNSINNDVQLHLSQKARYRNEIKAKLKPWIKDDRNGFLHKDIQSLQELERCIRSTFALMFLIVLAVKK